MAWKPAAIVFPVGSDASVVRHRQVSLLRDIAVNGWKDETSPQGPAISIKKGTRGYVLQEPRTNPGYLVLAIAEYGVTPVSMDALISRRGAARDVIMTFATLRDNFYVDV